MPGLKGLIVSQDPSNADTPRAHITNMAAIGKKKWCMSLLLMLILYQTAFEI